MDPGAVQYIYGLIQVRSLLTILLFNSGTGIDISNTSTPFLLPGAPGNPVTDYPEG